MPRYQDYNKVEFETIEELAEYRVRVKAPLLGGTLCPAAEYTFAVSHDDRPHGTTPARKTRKRCWKRWSGTKTAAGTSEPNARLYWNLKAHSPNSSKPETEGNEQPPNGAAAVTVQERISKAVTRPVPANAAMVGIIMIVGITSLTSSETPLKQQPCGLRLPCTRGDRPLTA